MIKVNSIRFQQLVIDPERHTAEEMLWRTVIYTVIEDVAKILENATEVQNSLGSVKQGFQTDLLRVEREVASEWFKTICLWVDVDQSHIVKLIERIKKKYHYSEMKFE